MLGYLGLGSKGCVRYGGEREKRHVSEIHNEHQRSSESCYTKCPTAAKIDGSAAAGATFPPLQPPGGGGTEQTYCLWIKRFIRFRR